MNSLIQLAYLPSVEKVPVFVKADTANEIVVSRATTWMDRRIPSDYGVAALSFLTEDEKGHSIIIYFVEGYRRCTSLWGLGA